MFVSLSAGEQGQIVNKPTVTPGTPSDADPVNAFLNVRVADTHANNETCHEHGAVLLAPPIDINPEIRCYMRDPDGHLIEVCQAT